MNDTAGEVVRLLRRLGWTVGTAESLTGGLLVAALVDVPGASAVVRGGIVSYATDIKERVLGVDPGLLSRSGAVDPDVARLMAAGACRVLQCQVGVSTTGVAGPEPSDGMPVGTVFVAVSAPGVGIRVRRLHLSGDRGAIRDSTVREALHLLAEVADAALAAAAVPGPGDG